MIGELSEREIEEVLRSEVVARLGCHAKGRTYVVPITYAYDGTSVIGHSAPGLKISMMRENPEVCIEVDHVEDAAHWRSVVARARFEELEGPEALDAMERLVARLGSLVTSETSQPSHATRDAVEAVLEGKAVIYRLRITEATGRFERP
jgi:nitroimidazol reductase NimA-like FMN-containing flavoprotein (pyridoxamine 5'-phosphate oxidase superfamily)